jgi:hypothetical protein
MIDFAKKITKSCSGDLEAGEIVHAGTFVQPAGATRSPVTFGAIGGAVGMVAGNAMAQKRVDENQSPQEGLVLDIPAGKAVLGITDRRFLVFGHSTSIDFDVVKTAKPGPFVDAFRTVTGR